MSSKSSVAAPSDVRARSRGSPAARGSAAWNDETFDVRRVRSVSRSAVSNSRVPMRTKGARVGGYSAATLGNTPSRTGKSATASPAPPHSRTIHSARSPTLAPAAANGLERGPGGCGSVTMPPPMVSGGDAVRNTKRSPARATTGASSTRRAGTVFPFSRRPPTTLTRAPTSVVPR